MSRVIHVFDENPDDSKELASAAVSESIQVSADEARSIEAEATAIGEGVHYYPTENAENFTYTQIDATPD